MRAITFIVFGASLTFLICGCFSNREKTVSSPSADDISVISFVTTNNLGSVSSKDYVMRAGKTNLVRIIVTTNGVVRSRIHRFYHDGHVAATHSIRANHTAIMTLPGYSLTFHITNDVLTDVFLSDEKDRYLDLFTITNGMLTPLSASALRKQGAIEK